MTATGESSQTQAHTGSFAIRGTFVAIVELQRKIQGTWNTIATYTVPTVETDDTVFDNGLTLFMRFNVSAYTSGTIEVELEN